MEVEEVPFDVVARPEAEVEEALGPALAERSADDEDAALREDCPHAPQQEREPWLLDDVLDDVDHRDQVERALDGRLGDVLLHEAVLRQLPPELVEQSIGDVELRVVSDALLDHQPGIETGPAPDLEDPRAWEVDPGGAARAEKDRGRLLVLVLVLRLAEALVTGAAQRTAVVTEAIAPVGRGVVAALRTIAAGTRHELEDEPASQPQRVPEQSELLEHRSAPSGVNAASAAVCTVRFCRARQHGASGKARRAPDTADGREASDGRSASSPLTFSGQAPAGAGSGVAAARRLSFGPPLQAAFPPSAPGCWGFHPKPLAGGFAPCTPAGTGSGPHRAEMRAASAG